MAREASCDRTDRTACSPSTRGATAAAGPFDAAFCSAAATASAIAASPAVSAGGTSPGTYRANPGTLVSMPSNSDASPFSFSPGIALSTSW